MYHPVSLAKSSQRELVIVWDDGVQHLIPYRVLRKGCPCATCREKAAGETADATSRPRGGLPVLSPGEARPLELMAMTPAGNYAYNIAFSDGHGSGLFTFDYLRELGDLAASARGE